jgi:hypothetical protein
MLGGCGLLLRLSGFGPIGGVGPVSLEDAGKVQSKVMPCVVSLSLMAFFSPEEGDESLDAAPVSTGTVDDEAAGWAQGEAGRDEHTEDRPDSVSKPGETTPVARLGSGEEVADVALCVGEGCREAVSNDAQRSDKGVPDRILSSSAIAPSALLISSADTLLHACGDLAPLLDGEDEEHLRVATLPM